MSPFLRLPIFVCSLAALARGQIAPPAPAPAPPAPEHPVLLDQFVTSASPFARNAVDLAQSTTVLAGRALLLQQQSTLGETLALETGMSSTAFGPGASRPIIRGLGGDRIRLLENSVGTIDASVTSPDHAVSVEPFLVERIEILRGPAALLYGSSAVGGVVNTITHRIETEIPAERARGRGEIRYGSAAREIARGGLVDLALVRTPERALVLHLDGFRRTADDVAIPGFAESARVRATEAAEAQEHGEPLEPPARDRLPNSSFATAGAAAGLSLVGKNFFLGASHSGLDSNYGVPGHAHEHAETAEEAPGGTGAAAAGVRIDLRQRRTDVQGEWRGEAGPFRTVRLKVGRADYQHREIEPDGAVGTVFTHRGYDARLELLHGRDEGWHGAIGAQASRTRFAAVGEEAFLPPSLNRDHALFAFEEMSQGPVTWQLGARLERAEVTPDGGAKRRDDTLAGSLGAVWKLDETHALAFSLAHTGRAPNAQELFAYGAHAGTRSFEIGDATLGAEKSLGLELSLRRRKGFVTGAATVFANRFHGYIFEQPTGLVALEHEGDWEFLPPDGGEAIAHGGGLPVYRQVARDARFWGAELETLWHLHDAMPGQLDLRLAADFTRGREEGGPLPRIPAARVSTGVRWTSGPWHAGVDAQWTFAQKRVAANETPGERHVLLGMQVSRVHTAGRLNYEFFVRGTNLFDEEIRPHTSFVKELAPLAGRAANAGVRIEF